MIYRVSSAHEEGGERMFAVNTARFLDNGSGAVRALEIVDVEMREGRFEVVAGSERELAADLVFLAMGFTGPERGPLVEQFGLDLDERGNVRRDGEFRTNLENVFVAGDAGRGQSLIVWAIAEGRAAASAVDRHLAGTSQLPRPITPTTRSLTV
jgi:glutamate synthase (NADPH/NADH) small chain